MDKNIIKKQMQNVIENMPTDWLRLTTHRLDIYNEEMAKVDFLNHFEKIDLTAQNIKTDLEQLPTAFDYIRLGHPLSCVLEWAIAKSNSIESENVISFSSQTMPLLAILRKNLFDKRKTQIVYTSDSLINFDHQALKEVYQYDFELVPYDKRTDGFKGSQILLCDFHKTWDSDLHFDFQLYIHDSLGSVILTKDKSHISEIQHVRRRESIAMTPHDCHSLLGEFVNNNEIKSLKSDETQVIKTINEITHTRSDVALGSCGLSVQYAIMMGLIDHAQTDYPGHAIKFIVPPNCYGGTNDQARRVAACHENVEIIDLPVDSGSNMVDGIEEILSNLAKINAVPFIIAEIPTNPRVEIPDLERLKATLSKMRKTSTGKDAIESVFILDQTFCPNTHFLGDGDYLYDSKALSYVSGSKFPSGGLCTAGYCVANDKAKSLMTLIKKHLKLCHNEATAFQVGTLTAQMPSMNERIQGAYKLTRSFVDFIEETLPSAKINFVSHKLADLSFTPSVFSLDLPTIGKTHEEREAHKRELNALLIKMMIHDNPNESKHCVSYGQLKGVYWTIPATSTQGTTKEGDKDYIVRVSGSSDFDLESHKETFKKFCDQYIKK